MICVWLPSQDIPDSAEDYLRRHYLTLQESKSHSRASKFENSNGFQFNSQPFHQTVIVPLFAGLDQSRVCGTTSRLNMVGRHALKPLESPHYPSQQPIEKWRR